VTFNCESLNFHSDGSPSSSPRPSHPPQWASDEEEPPPYFSSQSDVSLLTEIERLTSDREHPYFRDSLFGSQTSWLGGHPEASGHGSSKRRASRGISVFSSLGKIHGLTNQFA